MSDPEFGGVGPPPPEVPEEHKDGHASDGEPLRDAAETPTEAPQTEIVPAEPIDFFTQDRALILAILRDGLTGYFLARDKGLRSEHLDLDNQPIWDLIADFAKKGRVPTFTEIQAATGIIVNPIDEPFDVDLFATQLANRALRRKLDAGLRPIVSGLIATDPKKARDLLVELVRNTSWSIGGVASYTDASTANELRAAYDRAKNLASGGLLGYSSPWPSVDRSSLGLQDGELTVLLAKRKVGKSWILFKWLHWIWEHDLKPGERVLLVSMEMPKAMVWRRLCAIDLMLCYSDFRAGRLNTPAEDKFFNWVKAMQTPDPSKPIFEVIGPNVARDVSDISAKVAELNPKVVGIDGFYILGRDRRMGMWERTLQNVSEIKLDLCDEHGVPVVATTQLKGSKDKDSLDCDGDDAAYAKAIGDYADAMRSAHMNEAYRRNKQRVFRGKESREFESVDIVMHMDLDAMNFNEIKVFKGADPDQPQPEFDGPQPPTPVTKDDVQVAGSRDDETEF